MWMRPGRRLQDNREPVSAASENLMTCARRISRAFRCQDIRGYPLQTHEMQFDAHNHAFQVLGGVPCQVSTTICAPRSTGSAAARIDRSVPASRPWPAICSEPSLQSGFGLGEGSGWEERSGCLPRLWQPMPRFPSLEALNGWLEQLCRELWQQITSCRRLLGICAIGRCEG